MQNGNQTHSNTIFNLVELLTPFVDFTDAEETAGFDSVVAVGAWFANKSLLGRVAVPLDKKEGIRVVLCTRCCREWV